MPHKRSPKNLISRLIRSYIFRHAYLDRERGETVNRISRKQLLSEFSRDGLPLYLIPHVEPGEVLVDSRGEGSFQRVEK